MFGLDDLIAGLGAGHPILFATAIAALLGLRHATDPDHLAAVTTLVADGRGREAGRLGLIWGAGHAVTLAAFGLPIVVAARYLPPRVQELAEAFVGVMIVALAVRLLVRWRRGAFQVAEHDHGAGAHRHIGATDHAAARTPRTAFVVGLVHGMGGSAGVGALLLASIASTPLALVALAILAAFTAVSMAIITVAFGALLARPLAGARMHRAAPAFGLGGVAFGVWYVAAAFALAPYPF